MIARILDAFKRKQPSLPIPARSVEERRETLPIPGCRHNTWIHLTPTRTLDDLRRVLDEGDRWECLACGYVETHRLPRPGQVVFYNEC